MAPHGKETTPELKDLKLKLSCESYSHAKVSEVTRKNRQSISKIIQRSNLHGDEEINRGRGRVKKTNPRSERDLFLMVRKNRRQTLYDLTSRYNERYGHNISSRTIR